MTLADSDTSWANGSSCEGQGGYSDIAEGAQVTVSDGSGKVLAVGQLLGGTASETGSCVFPILVSDVPDADFYAIEVTHRGAVKFSREELKNQGWSVFTSLGD